MSAPKSSSGMDAAISAMRAAVMGSDGALPVARGRSAMGGCVCGAVGSGRGARARGDGGVVMRRARCADAITSEKDAVK